MEYHNTFIQTKIKVMFIIKDLDEKVVLQTNLRQIFILSVRFIAKQNKDNPDEIVDDDSISETYAEFSINNVENAKRYINFFTNDMYISK